jgi:integrase
MAQIENRGDGQWRVRIRRKGYPAQSRTFESYDEAETWATNTESEMRRGVFHDRTEAEKTTLYALLERYLREVVPRHKGAEKDISCIRAVMRHKMAQTKMAGLTASTVAAWRDERLKEISGASVRRYMGTLSGAVNYARRHWGIHCENPFALVDRPPDSRARDRRLNADEEARMLAALNVKNTVGARGVKNIWLLPFYLFAIETAMRRSEILSLNWKRVDLEKQTARLPDTKNGQGRIVPLSASAVEILRELPRPEEGADGQVFCVTASQISGGWKTARKNAEITDYRLHDGRHEGTTRLAELLPNPLELAFVTGHMDMKMLKRYYNPRAEDLAKKLG